MTDKPHTSIEAIQSEKQTVFRMSYDSMPDLTEIIERLHFELIGAKGHYNNADFRLYLPRYIREIFQIQSSMKHHMPPSEFFEKYRDIQIVDGYENKIVMSHYNCCAIVEDNDLVKSYDIETQKYSFQ